jgi:hypothetical protein
VGFALVEVLAGPASQLGILDPVESEERAFQAFRRPSSRSAAATPFCLGWEASWRMISEAVTVPLRMDAPILRISAQCARIRAISVRPDCGDTTSNTELRLGGMPVRTKKGSGV